MKITQRNIRMVLLSASEKGLTEKDILSALNQKKRKLSSLKKALFRLTKSDQCIRLDNKYFILSKSKTKPTRKKHSELSNKPLSANGKKRSKSPNGIVIYNNTGPFVYSFADNICFNLDTDHAKNFFHGDTVRFRLLDPQTDRPIAYVTRIVERKILFLVGTLKSGQKKRPTFVPNSRHRYPGEFHLRAQPAKNSLSTDRILLSITQYPSPSSIGEGTITTALSDRFLDMPIMTDILARDKILTRFPSKVLKAADRIPQRVILRKSDTRKDLRHIPFVTIDGRDAMDFDDAIFAETTHTGYKIWVSIADVADYVKAGTETDTEAQIRGCSTYLPGTVYPMLPEILSNELCSLKEGVNRKTITCEIVLDEKATPKNFKIYESIIRVSNRLTYEIVDEFFSTGKIKTKNPSPNLAERLNLFQEISSKLELKRNRRGAIEFDLPETQFDYDARNHIIDIKKRFQTPARRVIEQFMLEANENVAEYCLLNKLNILWRNHPPPLSSKIKELKQLIPRNSFSKNRLNTSREFNLLLKESFSTGFRSRIEYQMLRSMSLAVYDTENKGHFGLAARNYCHFTSPIRRYPDLLVHRTLKNHWAKRRSQKIVSHLAEQLTDREKSSASAERAAEKLAKTTFMAGHIGDLFNVKIVSFQWNGLFVEIEHPYVEGFVNLKTILDDSYEYNERHGCIIGRKHGKKIGLGVGFKAILTKLDMRYLCPELDWLHWHDN